LGNSFVNLYPQYDLKKADNSAPINPFVKSHLNSVTNYKKLNNDLNRIQNGVDVFIKTLNSAEKKISNNPLQMLFAGLLSVIPVARRITPIEDNDKNNNVFKAVGLGLLALINLKEDFRDILSTLGKTKSELDPEFKAVFKFFAGTPVEPLLKRSELGRKIFYEIDTTLADTTLGNVLENYLKVDKEIKKCPKKIFYPFVKKAEIIEREYVKFTGKYLSKIFMLSLRRITKLGLLFAAVLELPKLVNETKKGNYKQIPKSLTNIATYAFFGAFVSSLGAYTIGTAGSVFGLGIGLYLGNKISKLLNSNY
jgi:hypothetical protein